ncbi:hypothetical protein CLV93_11215 [Prolixibacter denitrificans]|uniref:Uncharacterized protein n=1 Tax=Prolixibacter denitrificans TaxID=1541063 RepID=A0A2P8C7D1_9BACT|nr:hypothetical protein CLV93_11215 [Prolixibacter denitrificans]
MRKGLGSYAYRIFFYAVKKKFYKHKIPAF